MKGLWQNTQRELAGAGSSDRLKLKVNEAKSAVARPEERKFLGFSIANDVNLVEPPRYVTRMPGGVGGAAP